MAKEQLDCPQRMRAVYARIEPDATDPVSEDTGILWGREGLLGPALSGKQELSLLPVSRAKIFIDRLPGLFGDLEPHRPAGLLLADRRTFNRISVWGNVLDLERHDIAPAQLAIDGEIEKRQ